MGEVQIRSHNYPFANFPFAHKIPFARIVMVSEES
jgi:hypothetical protein